MRALVALDVFGQPHLVQPGQFRQLRTYRADGIARVSCWSGDCSGHRAWLLTGCHTTIIPSLPRSAPGVPASLSSLRSVRLGTIRP
jgi:hypothetical protein